MKINEKNLLDWGIFASFTTDKNAHENGYRGGDDEAQFELVLPDEVQGKIYQLVKDHLDQAETIALDESEYIF